MNSFNLQTEFDAYRLGSKDEYAVYYNMLLHAMEQMTASYKSLKLTDEEQELLIQYILYLTRTIKALRLRYLYDDEHTIRLDVHESGFPSYLELRSMYNELLVKRDSNEILPSTDELRNQVIDYICTEKNVVPEKILHKSALAYYTQSFKPEDIYYRGIMSRLLSTKNPEVPSNSYFISWSAYDNSLNRPLIYFMYFTYSGKDIQSELPEIQKIIRDNGDYLRELFLTANTIDRSLPNVHPKLLKCIDIGPFYSMYSKDEDELSVTIIDGIKNNEIQPQSYCLKTTIDTLHSNGESEVKSGIFGNKHQIFQKFYVPTSNERGSTETQEYVFGSHAFLQYLSAKKIDAGNYIVIPEIPTASLKKQL